MKTRVITGVVLVALISLVIWLGGWWLRGVALLLMLLSMHEMYAAYRFKGLRPCPWGWRFAPLLLFCTLVLPGDRVMEAAVSIMALLAAVGVAVIVLRGNVDGPRLQATLLPLIYPGVFYILLFDLSCAGEGMRLTLLFVLLFLVPLGQRLLCPLYRHGLRQAQALAAHQPQKDHRGQRRRPGGCGGVRHAAAQVRVPALRRGRLRARARVVLRAFRPYGRGACAGGRPGRVPGQARLRIKDFGKIFPGHGGVMDRLDGILFATLACHMFFRVMG